MLLFDSIRLELGPSSRGMGGGPRLGTGGMGFTGVFLFFAASISLRDWGLRMGEENPGAGGGEIPATGTLRIFSIPLLDVGLLLLLLLMPVTSASTVLLLLLRDNFQFLITAFDCYPNKQS